MLELELFELLKEFGFPAAIALILLYDKIKTNNSLMKVVENNNSILRKLEMRL